MTLGEQLEDVRLARGFSLGEVQRRSGGQITDGGLSRIEKGDREPLLGTLQTLCRVLGARIVIDQRGQVTVTWTKRPPRKETV